jgi:L-threonylcarbamoyladenylate synthase
MNIIRIEDDKTDSAVHIAVEVLQEGGVVACPTDTVYGLLADATNEKAVEKVFAIKGREKGKPLPVFVADINMAKRLAHILKEQEEFLKKSWPGKVTAIMRSKHVLPRALEGDEKIALRVPNYKLVNMIVEKFGQPITGTSANVSGQPSCFSAQEIVAQFQERELQPDLVLDAGELPASHPSQIVDITGEEKKVIRK